MPRVAVGEQVRCKVVPCDEFWNPTEVEQTAAGHAPEAERFDKDFAIVERHNRQQERQRHDAIIGARRQERLDREEERWQVAEQARMYVAPPALALLR